MTIAVLGILVLIRERSSPSSVAFYFMSLCGATWLLAYGGLFAAHTEALALFWAKAENVAVVFIPSLTYVFTLTIIQRFRQYRIWVLVCLGLSVLFSLLVVFTDGMIAGIYRYPWGYYARSGPIEGLFLGFFFGLMITSLRLYWVEYRRCGSGVRKQRLGAFFLAFCVAYVGSIDFLPAYGILVYPSGYLAVFACLVIVAQAIWRYRLEDLTPAFAASQILETMEAAAVIADLEGRIHVVNRAACSLLDYRESDLIGMPISMIIESSLDVEPVPSGLLREGNIRDHVMVWRTKEGKSVDVNVSASVLKDKSDFTVGIVYVAVDMAVYK